MRLELSVSKKQVKGALGSKEEIVFTVIDLDKAEKYPSNFVCLLPKITESQGNTCKFIEIYGKAANQIANQLLTNALRSESDPEVKGEIEKRLKALEPKPKVIANVLVVVVFLSLKKTERFLLRKCQTCRSKDESSR